MKKWLWIWGMLIFPLSGVEVMDRGGHQMDFYGKVRLSTSHVSQESAGEGWYVSNHKSRLGIKGTQITTEGISLFYRVEVGLDLVDKNKASQDFLVSRDTYMGVKGSWGAFSLGRHNTAFKVAAVKVDLFNHTLADADAVFGRTASGKDINLRMNNSLSYVSPKKGAWNYKVQVGVEDEVKTQGNKAKQALNLSAHYSKNGTKFDLVGFGESGAYQLSSNQGHAWAIRTVVSHPIGKHRLGVGLESIHSDIQMNERVAGIVSWSYSYGKGQVLKAQAVRAEDSDAGQDEATMYTLGWSQHLGKKSEIYGLVTRLESKGGGYALAKQGGSDVFVTAADDVVQGVAFGFNYAF